MAGDFGYYALESLRLEAGYRMWGSDLSTLHSPYEAGLGSFVRLDKGDFIGRAALARLAAEGTDLGLTTLVVDAVDADCHGHEPIWAGDKLIGSVECGGYGHTVGASLAYGYLPTQYRKHGMQLELAILGDRRAATVYAESPLHANARPVAVRLSTLPEQARR